MCSYCLILHLGHLMSIQTIVSLKVVMECFDICLYNTPIFAQSSLRQGTL